MVILIKRNIAAALIIMVTITLITGITAFANASDRNIQPPPNNKRILQTLSQDKSRIAFLYKSSKAGDYSLYLGVINSKTKNFKSTKISSDSGFRDIVDLKWITPKKISATIHINPDLEEYYVIDIQAMKVLYKTYGVQFIWNSSGTNLYVKVNPPHFSDIRGNVTLSLYNKLLYTSPNNVDISDNIAISRDEGKLAFFESAHGTGKNLMLVILTRNTSGNKYWVKKYQWTHTEGSINWINDKTLIIAQGSNPPIKYTIP